MAKASPTDDEEARMGRLLPVGTVLSPRWGESQRGGGGAERQRGTLAPGARAPPNRIAHPRSFAAYHVYLAYLIQRSDWLKTTHRGQPAHDTSQKPPI